MVVEMSCQNVTLELPSFVDFTAHGHPSRPSYIAGAIEAAMIAPFANIIDRRVTHRLRVGLPNILMGLLRVLYRSNHSLQNQRRDVRGTTDEFCERLFRRPDQREI
jgi:hypothetical protein